MGTLGTSDPTDLIAKKMERSSLLHNLLLPSDSLKPIPVLQEHPVGSASSKPFKRKMGPLDPHKDLKNFEKGDLKDRGL